MAGRRLEDLNLNYAPLPDLGWSSYPELDALKARSLGLDLDDDPAFARFCYWGGFWVLALVLASVVFSVGCNHPNAQAAEEPITTDEACELLVTHALRELFDGWATRYQYVVWCNRGDQKSIHVSITPSNRQEGRQDPALMERQAEAAIHGLLKRKQWQSRYTRVVFQFY